MRQDRGEYAVDDPKPGRTLTGAIGVRGGYLRDVVKLNADNFRIVGPDETVSNRLGDVLEKEILNVITDAEDADEIFEFIFFEAEINQPHGGMIFMTKLGRTSHFELPDIPEEED